MGTYQLIKPRPCPYVLMCKYTNEPRALLYQKFQPVLPDFLKKNYKKTRVRSLSVSKAKYTINGKYYYKENHSLPRNSVCLAIIYITDVKTLASAGS